MHGETFETIFVYRPFARESIRMIEFCDDCHLILVLRRAVICLDLVSMSIIWTRPISYDFISCSGKDIVWSDGDVEDSGPEKKKKISKIYRMTLKSDQRNSPLEELHSTMLNLIKIYALPHGQVMLIAENQTTLISGHESSAFDNQEDENQTKKAVQGIFTSIVASSASNKGEVSALTRSFSLQEFSDISIFSVSRLFHYYLDQEAYNKTKKPEIDMDLDSTMDSPKMNDLDDSKEESLLVNDANDDDYEEQFLALSNSSSSSEAFFFPLN